jgi:diaminohydroxyphosphoribosylaminopyrimidine deaminase/5-amino-6-(5-phosphoribosylamino)uracil reductase
VEGGAKTHNFFLRYGLWDEIRIFQSNEMLYSGTKAAQIQGKLIENKNIGDNKLLIFRNIYRNRVKVL